jgi:hypothetical protein
VPNPVNDACFADLRIEASATIAATPDAVWSGLRLQLDADPTAAPSLLEWRLQALRQGIEATLGRLRALLNG